MSTDLLYGQPGTGKSTLATGMALDYLRAGRRVVANFPIDAAPASMRPGGPLANAVVEVLPSRPSFQHIKALGVGWCKDEWKGREEFAGLLLIDEAGPWLDSRKWQDSDRPKIIDWLLHSRKRGWDIVLIAQSPALVDKQVREAVVEGYARCRRTDRMRLPVLNIKLPRMHIAVSRYGMGSNDPVLRRWFYRGGLEHKCFQSYALFDVEDEEEKGWYSTLPARITKWKGKTSWGSIFKDKIAQWLERPRFISKPGHPVVELLKRLPHDQRVKHWKRLNDLGVFELDKTLPFMQALMTAPGALPVGSSCADG